MVDASLKGAVDDLSDLKSNVIIGRLLPIGQEFIDRQEKSAFDLSMTPVSYTHLDVYKRQPLYIAMRIFSPFVIGKLIAKKIAYTPKQAEKMIKE